MCNVKIDGCKVCRLAGFPIESGGGITSQSYTQLSKAQTVTTF